MKDFEFIFSESRICKLSDVKFGGAKTQAKADNRLSVRKSLAAAAVDLHANDKKRKTFLKSNNGNFESNDDNDMRNSRFSENEAEKKISQLAQVHLVIEHLLLIQNNLTIDNDYAAIAKKLFEKPLIPFDDLPKFDKFEIGINDKKVSSLVENISPNAQKITFFSANKFKEVKSVFYFNLEQIVPSLMSKEKEEVVGDGFHFISYTSITSKF